MARKYAVKLSHQQFFQACETLREHQASFVSRRLNAAETAEELGKLCKFSISIASIADIKLATCIDWTARYTRTPNGNTTNNPKYHAHRTLARAVMHLYTKLGETPPDALINLIEYFSGK